MIVAIVFGVMFVKGSVRINLQKFFRVTTVILFFVAAQLIISGLHELSENGVLPSSREEMALIGPIVRNDLFFFVTIVALAALMVLFEVKRRQPAALPDSPAERRKALWSARRERLWMVSVYASSFLFILMVTAEFIYAKSVSALSPATEVTFQNGQVSIPLAQVSDGDLHRFEAKENGVDGSLLAVPEARRQSCHGVRRLPDLRPGRVLQGTERRGLQELRRADQRTIGGHDRAAAIRFRCRPSRPPTRSSFARPTSPPGAHIFQP